VGCDRHTFPSAWHGTPNSFNIHHSKFKRSASLPVEAVSNRFKGHAIHRLKQLHFIYGMEVSSVNHAKE